MMRYVMLSMMAAFALPLRGDVQAQQPETLEPIRRFTAQGFSRIRDVRELRDGRVLVADQRESAVYLIDFAAGTRRRIGGEGAGPNEYRQPTGLLALAGDTSLIIDIQNGRLMPLLPDLTFGNPEPMFSPGRSIPAWADAAGNLYWDHTTTVRLAKRENPRADQAAIARWQRTTGRIDTLASLTIPGGVNPTPFYNYDEWTVTRTGRIAIVRNQREYRVDWIEADGRVTRGTAVPFEPLRVDDADRDAWQAQNGGRGGMGGVTFGENAAPPARRRDIEFPDHFPPAKAGGVWATHDGSLWVERYQHLAETRPLFDLFDARGVRVRIVRLPAGRTVVGTGSSGIYAIRTDDDGLQWIEVYPAL